MNCFFSLFFFYIGLLTDRIRIIIIIIYRSMICIISSKCRIQIIIFSILIVILMYLCFFISSKSLHFYQVSFMKLSLNISNNFLNSLKTKEEFLISFFITSSLSVSIVINIWVILNDKTYRKFYNWIVIANDNFVPIFLIVLNESSSSFLQHS